MDPARRLIRQGRGLPAHYPDSQATRREAAQRGVGKTAARVEWHACHHRGGTCARGSGYARWPARVCTQTPGCIHTTHREGCRLGRAGRRGQQMEHVARGEYRLMAKQDAVAASIGRVGGMARRRMLLFARPLRTRLSHPLHRRHGCRHGHDAGNGRHHDNERHGQQSQPRNNLSESLMSEHAYDRIVDARPMGQSSTTWTSVQVSSMSHPRAQRLGYLQVIPGCAGQPGMG